MIHRLRSVTVLLLFLAGTHAVADDPLALNKAIVEFCERNMGESIGKDGDCHDLAAGVLKACGGKPKRKHDHPGKGDFVWGEQVFLIEIVDGKRVTEGNFFDIRPGDIMQFRDTDWKGKIEKNGKIKKVNGFSKHHTAIVRMVQSPGRPIGAGYELGVYHQNSGGRLFITKGEYGLDDLKDGWVRVYRPLPKGKKEMDEHDE